MVLTNNYVHNLIFFSGNFLDFYHSQIWHGNVFSHVLLCVCLSVMFFLLKAVI